MMAAGIRKGIVQNTYDREAERYKNASTMQLFNLNRLLSLAEESVVRVKPRQILDVGCGQGPAAAVLQERGYLKGAEYLGIDFSPQMIAKAKETHESATVRFAVGDAERLDLPDQSQDFALSNVALHWLNQPRFGITPAKAFSEIHRVLRPGGIFAVSIPAQGKAERLLKVYRSVMDRYRVAANFDQSQYVPDPINRMHLHEVVDLASGAKFNVELGQLHYQPQNFVHPAIYLDALRAYGFTSYMAPIAPDQQETVWHEISEEFVRVVGEGPYVHDLYIAYVIAAKSEV